MTLWPYFALQFDNAVEMYLEQKRKTQKWMSQ